MVCWTSVSEKKMYPDDKKLLSCGIESEKKKMYENSLLDLKGFKT